MSKEFVLTTTIPFGDVGRDQVVLLPQLFKLLQEAAIQHADLYGVGARGIALRGTSWVLNRLAVGIHRYPHRDEAVSVTTWSTGVRGFKGYREFRLHSGSELLLSASSLWLWIDLRTRSLARVPESIVHTFPIGDGSAPFQPEIDKLRINPPEPSCPPQQLGLRYSDLDANSHVNHTAYLDLLQTGLLRSGFSPQPRRLEILFQHEIPAEATCVELRLAANDQGAHTFSLSGPATSYAVGKVS